MIQRSSFLVASLLLFGVHPFLDLLFMNQVIAVYTQPRFSTHTISTLASLRKSLFGDISGLSELVDSLYAG